MKPSTCLGGPPVRTSSTAKSPPLRNHIEVIVLSTFTLVFLFADLAGQECLCFPRGSGWMFARDQLHVSASAGYTRMRISQCGNPTNLDYSSYFFRAGGAAHRRSKVFITRRHRASTQPVFASLFPRYASEACDGALWLLGHVSAMRFWLAFLCGLLPAVLWRWVQTQREREPELRAFLQEVEDPRG